MWALGREAEQRERDWRWRRKSAGTRRRRRFEGISSGAGEEAGATTNKAAEGDKLLMTMEAQRGVEPRGGCSLGEEVAMRCKWDCAAMSVLA